MEFSRSEYPAMLANLQPSQAMAVLNDRVRQVERINNGIADWLQERRRLEEEYARGLRHLARKQLEDSSELGVFLAPWQKIVESANELADSHHDLATKIESDVEKPLRNFNSNNREMQSMPNMQGNLASLAKDYENAQKKAGKIKDKGGKPQASLESSGSQWESQAPFAFEQLQALDESRCNHLRAVLTQYQTHEVDQVERNRVLAERALNSLLNIETADEIKHFAMRQPDASLKKSSERRASMSQQVSQPGSSLAPPSSSHGRDEGDNQSGSIQEEKKSAFRGLKRLGTVVSRRRQSAVKPEREKASRPSREVQHSSTTGAISRQPPFLPPPTISESSPHVSPTRSNQLQREVSNLSTGAGAIVGAQRNIAEASVNGTTRDETSRLQDALQPTQNNVLPYTTSPVRTTSIKPEQDRSGFNGSSSSIDAITKAQQEAAAFADTAPSLKVDIQSTPITETGTDNASAMASMANTLRAQAVQPKRASTLRGRRDVRSAVFMPTLDSPVQDYEISSGSASTPVSAVPKLNPEPPVVTPLMASLHSASANLQSSPIPSRPSVSDDLAGSDSQSVRSMGSLGSMAPALRHPEMRSLGLNSSIIETVSAWLENGSVTRAVVIGELALANNPSNLPGSTSTEIIRLKNFQALEKVAPNPSFIKATTPEKPGEYIVDLASITRTQVAFKYQVHLSESTLAKYAPILITPAWKVEASQTSVILSYSLNTAFNASNVNLSNVTLAIHLEGSGKPTACQSKPAGTFSRERGVIFWKMDELVLSATAGPQKLLARFATDGEAKPGRIEARWEVDGAQIGSLGNSLSVSVQQSAPAAADPFADENGDANGAKAWNDVSGVRRLCSGTYVVQS